MGDVATWAALSNLPLLPNAVEEAAGEPMTDITPDALRDFAANNEVRIPHTASLLRAAADTIEVLERKYAELFDLALELRNYVPDYFAEKWQHDDALSDARAVIALTAERDEQERRAERAEDRCDEAVALLRRWINRDCAHSYPVEDCVMCADRDAAAAVLARLDKEADR